MKFLRLFLLSLVALSMAYAVSVWAVNPRGEFAPHLVPPIVRDNRAVKLRLYPPFARAGATGLILGSSRVVQMPPSVLDELTGLRFFNFAVERGRTEDYLAIYRWVRTRGPAPRLVVIGVDPESLQDGDGANFMLDRNPILSGALRRTAAGASIRRLRDTTKQYKQMFSTEYLHDAILSIEAAVHPSARTAREYVVEADGYLRYPRLESERSSGTFDLVRELRSCLPRYQVLYGGISRLSAERVLALRTLVSEVVADNARVVIWVMPNHPETVASIGGTTPYVRVLSAVRDEVREVSRHFPVATFDYGDGSAFDRSDWWDCGHMNERNLSEVARRMLGSPQVVRTAPFGSD